ncbi:MAG: transcriptional repressor, partial [Planctomycetota bacterium]
SGLLNRFQLDGRSVYEHDYGYPQHDHLYCTKCRELFEFHSDEISRIRDIVAAEQGFKVSGHRMIIQGVCQTCSKKKRQRRRHDLV